MKKIVLIIAMLLIAVPVFGFDESDCQVNRWKTYPVTIDKIAGTTCTNTGKVLFVMHGIIHKIVVQESNTDATTWVEACNADDQYDESCDTWNPGPLGAGAPTTSVFAEWDYLQGVAAVVGQGEVTLAERRLIELAYLYELYMVPSSRTVYQMGVTAGLNNNQLALFMSGCFVDYGLDAVNADDAATEYVLNSVKKKYNELGLTQVDVKWKHFLKDFADVYFE